MNTYTACKPRKSLLRIERTPLLLALTNALILCLGAAGCAAAFECRVAGAAFGAAILLLGCLLILSSRRIRILLLGTGIALSGILLTSWSVWRLVSRRPFAFDLHSDLPGAIFQLLLLAGSITFLAVPLHRIDRAAKQKMVMVKAQCIASLPEHDCILWRYRLGDSLYDWKESFCASFFLPCMGDCCILYADPEKPGQAVRIDRRMAAAQLAIGILLMVEVITAAASNL